MPGASTLPTLEFAPITIHIEYSVRNPSDGLTFVRPSDAYPNVCYRILNGRALLIDHSACPMYTRHPLLRMQHDAGSHVLTASGRDVPGILSL
jgi:hypothetical protein